MTGTKDSADFIQKADKANGLEIVNGVDANRLLSYLERIEQIEEEKKSLQNDIKEIFEEAKSANFDVKAIKQLLKIRKMDDQDRESQEYVVKQYRRALGI
ncbi:MAG TPA: hypothetical protein DD624_07295 [Alphaproteobacteria bacterium]|nr:hypothetical protein [Alphaproteobacteria bacterium]